MPEKNHYSANLTPPITQGVDMDFFKLSKNEGRTNKSKTSSPWIKNKIVAIFFLAVAIPAQTFAGYRTTFPHNFLYANPNPVKNGGVIYLQGRLQAQIPGPNPGWAKNVRIFLYVNGSKNPYYGKTNSDGYFSIPIQYWHNKPIPKNGTYVGWYVNSEGTPVYNPATSGGAGRNFLVLP